ncbi:hypothetical protein BC643_3154 [Mangrovibacterium diazotrophicum]|uniref:Uncharacterized protein n=1 Tax=Mangrovibacterium diazotrophicum TaxID=1261403 RepID=A0A419WBE4_9BACT|nr:hypothetical protein BC643_3154 [Mangrovibacterium diazotrophicum]
MRFYIFSFYINVLSLLAEKKKHGFYTETYSQPIGSEGGHT